MSSDQRVVKQIGLPEDLQHKLKMHALQKRKDLQEVADEAMIQFLDMRNEVRKNKGRAPDYVVSPTDSVTFNVRLSKTVEQKVRRAAEEDKSTGRRLIYTGLLNYARKNKLTPE